MSAASIANAKDTVADPVLHPAVKAKAEIFRTIYEDGTWEKTLLVSFPDERRALSTFDGSVVVRGVMNHGIDPACKHDPHHHTPEDSISYLQNIQNTMLRHMGAEGSHIVKMGTAVDIDNVAVVQLEQAPYVVTILATAGARSNAMRIGTDMGTYVNHPGPRGTINMILLTNANMTTGAMARAMITMTEGKSAALQDLNVQSSYTDGAQATGTGTDSITVVAGNDGPNVQFAGGHSLLGGLIGKAAHQAVIEALYKQNGFTLPKGDGK